MCFSKQLGLGAGVLVDLLYPQVASSVQEREIGNSSHLRVYLREECQGCYGSTHLCMYMCMFERETETQRDTQRETKTERDRERGREDICVGK